uniref:Uncharacterized protein n=1 Tax=viral metagenome TaxID=1070528 RepID=A0A6C0J857_9ZZZZ
MAFVRMMFQTTVKIWKIQFSEDIGSKVNKLNKVNKLSK